MLKVFAALTIAAAMSCVPLSAYAHHGHKHPPAHAKKVKKSKPPQKAGLGVQVEIAPRIG